MSGERIATLELNAMSGGSPNGYGGKFHIRLPVGVTYRELFIQLQNLAISQLALISMTLNGDEIVRVTGTELDLLRKAVGLHTNASTVVIPFSDLSQIMLAAQGYSALVITPSDNLVLTIETAAATAQQTDDADIANIELRATYETAPRIARTHVPRLYTDNLAGNKSGKNHKTGLFSVNASSNPVRLQRLIAKNGEINKLEILRNRVKIFEQTTANNAFDLACVGVTQQEDEFMYDAVSHGFAGTDALRITPDFEMDFYLDNAGDFDVLFQVVEVLPQPKAA